MDNDKKYLQEFLGDILKVFFILTFSLLATCTWTKMVCICFESDWYTLNRGIGVWLIIMMLRYIMMAAKPSKN